MKILVYGAGNIGSLYAAKLKNAGNDVAILATGKRLSEIRERGILLQDFLSGDETWQGRAASRELVTVSWLAL